MDVDSVSVETDGIYLETCRKKELQKTSHYENQMQNN
jgi:hypothetical protein